MALEPVIRYGLDAAGFVKILGECRPCRKLRQPAQIGEKYFWPLAGSGQHAIGCIAQCLEGFGQSNRRKALEFHCSRHQRDGNAWYVQYFHRQLAEVWVVTDARKRVFSPGNGIHSLRPCCCDLFLEEALLNCRSRPSGGLDFLKQVPRGFRHLAS